MNSKIKKRNEGHDLDPKMTEIFKKMIEKIQADYQRAITEYGKTSETPIPLSSCFEEFWNSKPRNTRCKLSDPGKRLVDELWELIGAESFLDKLGNYFYSFTQNFEYRSPVSKNLFLKSIERYDCEQNTPFEIWYKNLLRKEGDRRLSDFLKRKEFRLYKKIENHSDGKKSDVLANEKDSNIENPVDQIEVKEKLIKVRESMPSLSSDEYKECLSHLEKQKGPFFKLDCPLIKQYFIIAPSPPPETNNLDALARRDLILAITENYR